MDKEFLHKVNLESLQKETGLTLQGISELADVSVQTVYRWAWDKAKQGNRPSYNALIQLMKAGATNETLFGVSKNNQKHDMSRDDFIAGVKEALAALGKG